MRIMFFLGVIIFFQFCKNDKPATSEVDKSNEDDKEQKEIPRGVNQDWLPFENAVGKKPAQVNLMQAKNLQERIKNLLKEEYQYFQTEWNEETPIVVEDRILYTSGCKTGDCKSNKYLLFLDIADNNINIINFKYGKVKSWEESSIIGLPTKLLEQYETVRNDQGL